MIERRLYSQIQRAERKDFKGKKNEKRTCEQKLADSLARNYCST